MTQENEELEMDQQTQEMLAADQDFGFARVYTIELKYKQKPSFSRKRLLEKMNLYTGEVRQPEEQQQQHNQSTWEPSLESESDLLHFFHLNYLVSFADGEMPAQTSLMPAKSRPASEYETAVQQAWHWADAEAVVEECRYSLFLTDMMASGLEPKERLRLITGSLRAVLETMPCDAIYFRESDKLLEPGDYLTAIEAGASLYGAMNVRFFNVQGNDSEQEEMLMDTVGLTALGIPDAQCHYFDLEPGDVAQYLTSLAYYMFDRGDVIQDGETFGPSEELRWHCEHQYALAGPHRLVLDVDPGHPHYAGKHVAPLVDDM